METNRSTPVDQRTVAERDGSHGQVARERLPLLIRFGFRPMTRALNPLVLAFAGRRHIQMVAKLTHYGRRSERKYVTPVGARVVDEHVWIPLTFGSGSDWCRNVLAARGCDVTLRGVSYALRDPEVVNASDLPPTVRASFPLIQRFIFRLIGIQAYVKLDIAPTAA